uniref:Predicted transcriptional regulator, contains HTH domain n=1 Tax=Candidatus Kentrum sp. FM TaxID=2126340 RepID=A0A450SJV7_9GAMM|nr:MAG: Predicted transcriptional regulator, contains HTH domain [Candidatus Kentron sp. FM]VFJ64070.1 MAG: Predicted transcriptional regulator, contains HTH domain [Candidatus Kentron sp. FM]VFK14093.1 MAG: Predicted transcriptional regulator, contains HTH domain [Candidatus Kentron sp. FM]
MTPTELTDLIALGEGPTTEFKQSGADKSLGREICAFANAAGGTILIGVTDAGGIVGVGNHNRLKSQVQSSAHSAEPPIVVEMESINDVLCVRIPKQHKRPYSFGGKFFMREGASSQQMSRDGIRESFFREGQIHFDATYCPDYNLRDDLTDDIWGRFAERANIRKNVDKMITLRNLHLVKDGRMTYAGAWLLCNDITFYTLSAGVTCVMFRGTTNAHILDRRDFTGDLYSLYEDCMAYMQSRLNTALIPHARGRDERLELPEDALREALANAIAHRDYRSTANVCVRIYHDRLQIETPGGLPAGMREEDLGYKSVPRNPLLFDLLLRMNLVEKIGSGIQRIRDLCREHGVGEPVFDVNEDWVTVIFPRETVEVTQPINGFAHKDRWGFSDYFQDIRYRVERETLPDSDLTLRDTYTPSRYRLDGEGADDNEPGAAGNLEAFIDDWLAEKGPRQLALLGEYGQGKTTAAWLLSYRLIQRCQAGKTTRIPVLLALRGKSPRNLTPEELLATWAHRYRIDTQALLQLIIAGRVLLILEGFDEMDLTGDTEARLSHFRRLWQLSYPKAKILITGRPNFFLDDAELKSALGIQRPNGGRPYCQAVHLENFDTDQMEESLRAADAGVRDGIVALAKKDERFYEIVSRPSLLHIVSTLWQRENLGQYREGIRSALVMELFIQHSYRRQGAKQGAREGEPGFMALNTAERAYFMAGIAAYMGARRLPNQISKQQLDEAIRGLIRAIPDEVSRGVTTMENEANAPLRSPTRYDWKNREPEIIEHIETDVRACGLLVSDPGKDGHFRFAHESFLEFLQARVLSQLFAAQGPARISGASIANTWKLRIDDLKDSPEAMTFLAELLARGFREQGQAGDQGIAGELLAALVWGRLPGKRPWKSALRRLSVRPALWLVGRLVGRFGVRRARVVTLGLFAAAVTFAGMLVIEHGLVGAMAFPMTLSAAGIGLLLGYWLGFCMDFLGKQKMRIWRRLHLWYRACQGLRLEPQAMERTVGKGVVQVLEAGDGEGKE